MVISLIEFGLSEFAVFEFGYEQGASVSEGTLRASGQGNAVFDTQVVNLFGTAMAGSSQAQFGAQTLKVTSGFFSEGVSVAAFEGNALRYADIRSTSGSDAYFNPSYVIDASLSSSGFGDFVAIYVDPETFDASGRATVKFMTGYGLTTTMKAEGSTKLSWDNFAYSFGVMSSKGEGTVALKQGSWSVASMQSVGTGSVVILTLVRMNSGFEANSSGIFLPKPLVIAASKLSGVGTGVGKFNTQYTFNTETHTNGYSTSGFTADLLAQAVMEAMGNSYVNIRPGSPVSEFLPPAWDMVIRPYENRGAIWK